MYDSSQKEKGISFMFGLYLLSLIIGGGLLVFSLFAGGGNADSDIASDADIHADIHPVDVHTDLNTDVHADTHGVADSVKFFSLRNIIYFAAFFGLTGTLFTKIFDYPQWLVLMLSVFVGGVAAFFGYRLMKYLKSTETGEAISLNELIGKSAMVSMPMSKENKGKIYLNVKDSSTELIALTDNNSMIDNFKIRDEVFITRIENGIAYVSDKF